MPSYSTIEEKATHWKISARHIQFLCRKGKIEGAIKRAGAWFIPDDAPNPAKNTKSKGNEFEFVGTKSRIFNCAIKLFALRGFNNVSYKDIADCAGVRQPTVYGHFRTKQELLDTIYDFYCHFYVKERLSLSEMGLVVKTGSPMDIIRCIRYEFKDEYRQRMSDITKIVFQRLGADERAREIAKSLVIDEGIRYVESVFDNAIETGRFAPFDTHIMAVFINIVRIFTLYCWIVESEPLADGRKKLLEDEQNLYEFAANFLAELNMQELESQEAG